MRIGIDGLILSKPLTGIGHYTLELVRHLARTSSEDDFHVVSSRPFIRDLNSESDNPTNLSFIQAKVNPLTRHWWSIGLSRHIRKNQIQLFHGTNFEVPLEGNCPSVLTIHDLTNFYQPHTQKRNIVRRLRRRLPLMARAASMIITPTETVRSEVHERLQVSLGKIVAIPEAARSCFRRLPPDQTLQTRRRLGIVNNFVLYVGTLEPRKNLAVLVRAFEEVVSKSDSELQLVLAGGKGWMTDELFRQIAGSSATKRIILTGYLSDEELCALYSSCTVFVYPSLYEGFGLPPLEAMACGAPVVTSRIPSLMETVGDAALLVDPQDEHKWSDLMISLLEDENMRRLLAKKGTQRAAEFSWERAAEMTRIVYGEALARTS
jgi:glycosyltransferase involved in cell wall biosynthesis